MKKALLKMELSVSDNKGWVCVHRKLLEWEWYSDINVSRLFLHLLLKANFEDKKWQGKVINRGELVTSRDTLSRETGLSEMQVRTALNKLKSTSEITIKTTNHYTHITLCNYSIYQDKSEINNQPKGEQSNQPITNEQPTDNQPITTTKQYNNITIKQDNNIDSPLTPQRGNEIKKTSKPKEDYSEDFEEFWRQYPKKQAKHAAFKAYQKAIKKTDKQKILNGAIFYNSQCHQKQTAEQYIKQASGWLNDQRYDDIQFSTTTTGANHAHQQHNPTARQDNYTSALESLERRIRDYEGED